MKIQRGFKFPLLRTGQAEKQFRQQAGACRFVWNLFLKRQEYRRSRGHYIESFQTMCLHLTQIKKHYTWMKEVDSTVLQQTLKDLAKAYKDGFDKRQPNKHLPKLKKKHQCRNSFRYTQRVEVTHGNRVYLPKLGTFTFKRTRNIIGKIKNTTVSLDKGRWFVSFQTEYETPEAHHPSTSMVGIDLGVKRLVTLSDGTYVEGLNLLRENQSKLTRLQRQLAKKVRFSANWKKIKRRIGKLHRKLANIRHNLLHQLSHYLSKNHALLVFEELNIKGMTATAKGTVEAPGSNVKAKSGLNQSILQQGWSRLIDFCQYKQQWRGGDVLFVKAAGTSQTCSCCGHKSADNRVSQSVFQCVACGHTQNADDNASINIKAAGHAVLACGAPALASAMKQEPTGFIESQPLLFN